MLTSTAHAGPLDFRHHHDPLDDILAHTRVDLSAPQSPRIIDVDRMHANDCRLDLARGGACVLRADDLEPIDLEGDARNRALRFRFELLEKILDTAELEPKPTQPDLSVQLLDIE